MSRLWDRFGVWQRLWSCLIARIAEAEREGWLGEIEGLNISLTGANDKLTQIDRRTATTTVHLGMPTPLPPAANPAYSH